MKWKFARGGGDGILKCCVLQKERWKWNQLKARDEAWGRGLVCGILFGFKFGLTWAGDMLKYILDFYKLTFRLPFRLYSISFGRERKKEGKERLGSSRYKSAQVSWMDSLHFIFQHLLKLKHRVGNIWNHRAKKITK